MIVEYIRYALKAHEGDALVDAYRRAAAQLEAAPNCVAWELSRCVEEPTMFILRIEWDSAEGHLQGFRKGEHFPPFLSEIRPFIDEIVEMRHYEKTDVVSTEAAGVR